MSMIIWALLDGRRGNDNQTLAIAEKLGPHVVKQVNFKPWGKLPNIVYGSSIFGAEIDLDTPAPHIVISTGRKLARVSAFLKKQFGSKIIHVMYPGKKLAEKFDYVIVPEHDPVPDAENFIRVTGSITKIHAMAQPNTDFTVTVLVGDMKAEEAKELAGLLNQNPANYLITTSRRTSIKAIEALDLELIHQKYIYRFDSDAPNPYREFLAAAHVIVATGDSVNMCTEAAHTGKPLYIFETDTKPKFRSFWENLYWLKCARPFTDKLDMWEYKALSNLTNVVRQIKI